jgi:fructose-1,6-bisphosphatase/sedoheptulose 1,7-bisphosphatase-like protein
MQARLKFRNEDERARATRMMNGDIDRVLRTADLASGKVIFAATGITSGDLLKGVRYRRGYALTESIVMDSNNGTNRRIETQHKYDERGELIGA